MTNKILIIEDEPDIRSTLEYNLVKDGFKVVGVGSLVDARAAISMSSFLENKWGICMGSLSMNFVLLYCKTFSSKNCLSSIKLNPLKDS